MWIENELFIIKNLEESDRSSLVQIERENKVLATMMDRVEEAEDTLWKVFFQGSNHVYPIICKGKDGFAGIIEVDYDNEDSKAELDITIRKGFSLDGVEGLFCDFTRWIASNTNLKSADVQLFNSQDPKRVFFEKIGYSFVDGYTTISFPI